MVIGQVVASVPLFCPLSLSRELPCRANTLIPCRRMTKSLTSVSLRSGQLPGVLVMCVAGIGTMWAGLCLHVCKVGAVSSPDLSLTVVTSQHDHVGVIQDHLLVLP